MQAKFGQVKHNTKIQPSSFVDKICYFFSLENNLVSIEIVIALCGPAIYELKTKLTSVGTFQFTYNK